MKNGIEYTIEPCGKDRWDEACELAFRVFMKFEAKEYGQKGIDSFAEFLTSPGLEKLFKADRYKVYVAMLEGKIIGIVSLRSGNFLSLLFVDDRYHRQGIGSELLNTVREYLLNETDQTTLTVNASTYAIPFYSKHGFVATADKIYAQDGIIYTPMQMII